MKRRSLVLVILAAFMLSLSGQEPGVRCPVCVKNKTASSVFPSGFGSATLAYCQDWYDEKGVFHHHECNSSMQEFRCSLGHRWQVTSYGSQCPAGDYPRPDPTTTVIEDGKKK